MIALLNWLIIDDVCGLKFVQKFFNMSSFSPACFPLLLSFSLSRIWKLNNILNCWFLEFSNNIYSSEGHDLCSYYKVNLLCSRYCFRGSLDGYYTITSTRRKCSFLRYLNSCTAELLDVHDTLSWWANNSTYDTFVDFQLNLVNLKLQWYEMHL